MQTFTVLPRRSSAACATFHGLTQTEAKWYCRASSQSLRISSAGRVWLQQGVVNQLGDFEFGERHGLFRGQSQNADVFQIAIALGVIETVADDEIVGDLEADVVGFDFFDAARRLIEQRGDAQGFRFALG